MFIKRHQSIDAAPFNKIVHTIERLQECRLTATRGTDERGYLVLRKAERDILERMEIAIMKVQIANFHLDLLIYLIPLRCSLMITQQLLKGLFASKLRTLSRGWSIDRFSETTTVKTAVSPFSYHFTRKRFSATLAITFKSVTSTNSTTAVA